MFRVLWYSISYTVFLLVIKPGIIKPTITSSIKLNLKSSRHQSQVGTILSIIHELNKVGNQESYLYSVSIYSTSPSVSFTKKKKGIIKSSIKQERDSLHVPAASVWRRNVMHGGERARRDGMKPKQEMKTRLVKQREGGGGGAARRGAARVSGCW